MADVTSNLIAHWKFDGNGNDSSGSANTHNLAIAGVTYVNDKDSNANSAASYDGVNDSAYATQHGDFDIAVGGSQTLAFWLYRTTNTSDSYLYVTRDPSQSTSDGVFLTLWTNGSVHFNMHAEPSAVDGAFSGTISDGAWSHIVLVIDRPNDDATLYVNGTLRSSIDISSLASDVIVGDNSKIGINYTNPDSTSENYYDNNIDEFRVYQRALVQADIDQLYNNLDGNLPSSNSRFGKLAGVDRNKVSNASGVNPDNIKSINGVI